MSAASSASPSFLFAPYDRLPAAQRGLMVGAILAAHAAAIWGLLQIREVRAAVAEAAPMFVALIAPEKPAVIVPPLPAPPVRVRPPPRLIAAAPTPAPAPPPVMTTPPPEVVEPPAPAVVAAAPAPTPVPAPPAAPRVIPASAVQYLQPLALEYPRVSRRLGETGRVFVRVLIDAAGAAHDVQVHRSSSHPRLDEAAVAAVRKARFKPYTENGQPVAGWAYIPIDFELEQ